MGDVQPDDIFGAAFRSVDRRLLAVRRGDAVKDYGALFPGGRLWRLIVLVSYAELIVVDVSGVAAWQPVTGYLWLQLYVGLVPTVWRWMRPATQHEANAERRAASASQDDEACGDAPETPNPAKRGAEASDEDEDEETGRVDDEDIEAADPAPQAWVDELTPEAKKKLDVPQTLMRIILTPCLLIGAIVPLQLGLDIAVWGRQHWLIALPVAAALAVAAWLAYQKLRPLLAPAPDADEGPPRSPGAGPRVSVAKRA